MANLLVFALAVVSTLVALWLLVYWTQDRALNDVRAYYDAGTRLNEGAAALSGGGGPEVADFYRYPPLLAIVFRPLALLPYETAAFLWEAVVVASFIGTILWVGPRRRATWLAVGVLGVPIAYALVIAQGQVPLTFLTALGRPGRSPWRPT